MTPDPEQYFDSFPDPAARSAFDPPSPTDADWKRVGDAIVARVLPTKPAPKPARRWIPVGVFTAAGVAVGMFFGLWNGTEPRSQPVAWQEPTHLPSPPPAERDPLEPYAVLPIATDEELRIAALRGGDWDRGLIVGAHLLPGELPIASVDEVVVSRTPIGMQASSETGDEPMVFSIKARRTGE